MAIEIEKIQHRFERLTEDERKLLLVGLKILHSDIDRSMQVGYPVTKGEVKSLVEKLGGRPELL